MGIILAILLSPVFLVVSAAVKLDSKGPVFFRQKRVGIDGGLFEIFKFRSMTTESDPYAVNPTGANDARVTKVGKFLRKTSLDELPQLFNVLKGDMSFVGPRPEMPFIVESYSEIHRERLKALPGITGLWQLSGDREKAIHENMDYDLYYLKNRSFFLDVAILLETLLFAFRGV
jgi:lipopolysaccharide/colanic/teichoic acid biosynthesis glycosyltransferase